MSLVLIIPVLGLERVCLRKVGPWPRTFAASSGVTRTRPDCGKPTQLRSHRDVMIGWLIKPSVPDFYRLWLLDWLLRTTLQASSLFALVWPGKSCSLEAIFNECKRKVARNVVTSGSPILKRHPVSKRTRPDCGQPPRLRILRAVMVGWLIKPSIPGIYHMWFLDWL